MEGENNLNIKEISKEKDIPTRKNVLFLGLAVLFCAIMSYLMLNEKEKIDRASFAVYSQNNAPLDIGVKNTGERAPASSSQKFEIKYEEIELPSNVLMRCVASLNLSSSDFSAEDYRENNFTEEIISVRLAQSGESVKKYALYKTYVLKNSNIDDTPLFISSIV